MSVIADLFFFTLSFFFFFNDTATTEIYTLSLHDALPIAPPPTMVISASRGLDMTGHLQTRRHRAGLLVRPKDRRRPARPPGPGAPRPAAQPKRPRYGSASAQVSPEYPSVLICSASSVSGRSPAYALSITRRSMRKVSISS